MGALSRVGTLLQDVIHLSNLLHDTLNHQFEIMPYALEW